MGVNLARWAGRVAGVLKVPPVARSVLTIMARDALDYEVIDQPDKPKGLYKGSRAMMAKEMYGEDGKTRNLDRPVKTLVSLGLITPVGSAHNGATQWYQLNIDTLVARHMNELTRLYPQSSNEIGRAVRRVSHRKRHGDYGI